MSSVHLVLLIHRKLNLGWLEICAEEWHPGTWEWRKAAVGKDGRRTVILWPHSCFPGLHLLQWSYAISTAVLSMSIYSIMTGGFFTLRMLFPLCSLPSSEPEAVWLCLSEASERWETSGKWLLQQVNTSVIETITSPNPNPKGTPLAVLWCDDPIHTFLSAILMTSSLRYLDLTHNLEGSS